MLIGLGNGLLPDGAKLLSKPILPYRQLDPQEQTLNLNENTNFSFRKILLKMLSAKWPPFCSALLFKCIIYGAVLLLYQGSV